MPPVLYFFPAVFLPFSCRFPTVSLPFSIGKTGQDFWLQITCKSPANHLQKLQANHGQPFTFSCVSNRFSVILIVILNFFIIAFQSYFIGVIYRFFVFLAAHGANSLLTV